MSRHQSDEDLSKQQNPDLFLSPLTILLFLALLVLFGMMLGSGLTYILGKLFGLSLSDTMDTLGPDSGIQKRNFVRISLLANHCLIFILPPLILAFAFFKKRWYKFLAWRTLAFKPFLVNLLMGAFILLISMPLVQFLYYWNQQLPIPEWARTIDDTTTEMIKNLLITEYTWELIFNILVIAVIPAVGEEMVFRGVIQRRLEKWFKNPHIAIWLAAIIFSAFHVQLEGFLPRMLLGAVLGYLYFWSKSLWIPILIHFINNGLQVVVLYFFAKDLSSVDVENASPIPIWGALLSLLLLLMMSRFLVNFNQSPSQQSFSNQI